ncbi:hypothetical protein BSF38_02476 [Paludisphaera borealis]|uniref:Uncharacterized protein n=1 Tax=Paludisphaera borealis TaxID=1387353 RepID=A0A1U7CPZ0_9BACT|nr:hypothetical protein BSF38_02476 [Paludisphaera borealis]
MDRPYGDSRFVSRFIQDNVQGYSGLELSRTRRGQTDVVATIIFWDAAGKYSVETLGTDVPLEVIEELAVEARRTIEIS